MIPQECIYGLIGAMIVFVAGRLGLPIFASRTDATTLRDSVRQVLLEILKGLNEPPKDSDADLRKQIAAVVEKKIG